MARYYLFRSKAAPCPLIPAGLPTIAGQCATNGERTMTGDVQRRRPLTDNETRASNAEAWEPPSGMVKLRCGGCGYWFAAPDADAKRCPDCAILNAPLLGSRRAAAQ